MRPLLWTIAASGGRGRAVLVAAMTALTTALVLVAVSLARLYESDAPGYGDNPQFAGQEQLLSPMADPGTRGGAIFGVLLLTVPILLLLSQAVRLGSSSRQRRFSALAIGGATRADLRRWAAVEVGLPAAAGALLGVPLWWLMRQTLGRGLADHTGALVPTTVGPGTWTLLVVAAVAAYGVLVGLRSGSRTDASLQGTRGVRSPPRPWSALLLVPLVLVFLGVVQLVDSTLLLILLLALFVVGLVGLAPWAAYRSAAFVVRRTESPASLLAARRVMADARPAGRAAAAVGAVGVAGGVIGAMVGQAMTLDMGGVDTEVLQALVVVAACTMLAILVIAGSLAVHSTETVLERRRELAALVATGVPVEVVSASQRAECLIATLPLTTAGAVLGAVGFGGLAGVGGGVFAPAGILLTVAVTAGACWLVTWGLRPWVRDATTLDHLRAG